MHAPGGLIHAVAEYITAAAFVVGYLATSGKGWLMGALALMLDEQRKVSRNLGESTWFRGCRLFWSVVYLCAAIRVAIAAMRHEQLGSRIKYYGRLGVITNWAQHPTPSVKLDDGEYIQYADRAQIINVQSINEYLHRFSAIFWWYVTSWHGINVNKRIYPAVFASNKGA